MHEHNDERLRVPEGSPERVVSHQETQHEVRLMRPKAVPGVELISFWLRGGAPQPSIRYRPSYTLGIVDAGRCDVVYRGTKLGVSAGMVAVSRPFESARVGKMSPEGVRATAVLLDPSMVEDTRAPARAPFLTAPAGYLITTAAQLRAAIKLLLASLAEAAPTLTQETAAWRCARQLAALHAAPPPDLPSCPLRVQRARDYLHAHFDEDVTLADLSLAAGDLHPRYLLSLFSRIVGIPPHRYMLHLRVNRARELIARGATVARAAAEAGFYDQSQLHRHFVRMVGVTPGAYARACR